MTDTPQWAMDKAKEIISTGGQVMLPFDAGDATVRFTRYRLADQIAQALADERKRCAEISRSRNRFLGEEIAKAIEERGDD